MAKKLSLTPSLLLPLLALSVGCGVPESPDRATSAAAALEPLSFEQFVKAEARAKSVTAPTGARPKSDCDTSCAKRRQEFRYVVYVGKKIYAYWKEKKAETRIDYDKLAAELEKTITSKSSLTDYFVTLQKWAASFHDGHVNAFFKQDESELDIYTAPVRLELISPATRNERVVVSQINDGSRNAYSDTLQVAPGDEVLEVNGVPVRKAIDQAVQFTSGSTERMRRSRAARKLLDALGTRKGAESLTLRVRREGETLDVSLYRTAELYASKDAYTECDEDPDACISGKEYLHVLTLPGGIGYLRIDLFAGNRTEELLAQAMKRLSRTEALLIDVRRNGGGDSSADVILSALATSKIARHRTSARTSEYMLAARPKYAMLDWAPGKAFSEWKDELVEPSSELRYQGKHVALLTGPGCFSACDTFAAALKSNRLATILGEATGGGTGQPYKITLPYSKMRFRYSVMRGVTADDKPIEGVGTPPDFPIERTVEERAQGIDEQLNRAVDWLYGQLEGSKSALPKASAAALRSLPASWDQSVKISPTRAMNAEIETLSDIDEMPAE